MGLDLLCPVSGYHVFKAVNSSIQFYLLQVFSCLIVLHLIRGKDVHIKNDTEQAAMIHLGVGLHEISESSNIPGSLLQSDGHRVK